MSYFNHAFSKVFAGTHATAQQAYAGGAGTALTQAGIDKGFITSSVTTNGGTTRLKTSDLQGYGMGPGTFGFFDQNYDIVVAADLTGQGKYASSCCPLILAGASLLTNDKIGSFHGGYHESNKSKLINPKYLSKVYKVEACTPQQSVISIGTTPYTTGGALLTFAAIGGGGGTGYTAGDYALNTLTGHGAGGIVTVTVGAGIITAITAIVAGGAGYAVGDTVSASGGNNNSTFTIATITATVTDATCCKGYLCGETYYLRIDVKGSPALRALNHNAYYTVDYYTGCCADPTPTNVDPTLVYIGWAEQIIATAYLKDFILPVVFDFEGTAWYAPNTTAAPDGTAVTSAQWWNSYAPQVPWVDECTAGMRLYGAYVETTFGNCSFQVSDFFEKEPVRIYASLVDYTGDPCVFEGLCVYHECDGVQGMGFGEQAVRDLILNQSYLQNFFHSDIRIREITQGDDILSTITRNAMYTRYYLQHSVPRFNNPSGVFDNDQYLLEVVIPVLGTDGGTSASLETFLTNWLDTNHCVGCVTMSTESCTHCAVPLDVALV